MLRSAVSVPGLIILLTACGAGSSAPDGSNTPGSPPTRIAAPTDLNYHIGNYQGAIAVRMNVGLSYVLDPPTVVGTVTGYTISPTLPAGVSLNPSTGMISGAPQTGSPETVFTITASNDAGSTTPTIYVIVYVPPSGLTYVSPVDATLGTALAKLVPALSGDADRFSVQPALPAGLVLDSATGVVSGTPASERISASYTPVHWASVRTRCGNTHRDLSIFRFAMDPESPDTPYAATTYNAIFSKTSDNLLTAFMHAESHRATTERTATCGQRERSCDI